MKFGRVFPICVLLFICLQFQISDGVKCSHVAMTGSRDQIDDLLFNATKTKLKEYKGLPGFVHITNGKITCPEACADFWCGTTKETAVFGAGCPQDFYDICSTFSKEITEIQQKGTNDVEYFSRNVFYVSGCGSETDGTKCIKDKFVSLFVKLMKIIEDEDITTTTTTTTTPKSVSNGQNDASNHSNNKNDATKLIGIIIFGWIFALWNL